LHIFAMQTSSNFIYRFRNERTRQRYVCRNVQGIAADPAPYLLPKWRLQHRHLCLIQDQYVGHPCLGPGSPSSSSEDPIELSQREYPRSLTLSYKKFQSTSFPFAVRKKFSGLAPAASPRERMTRANRVRPLPCFGKTSPALVGFGSMNVCKRLRDSLFS
jgi:hypothetical protein